MTTLKQLIEEKKVRATVEYGAPEHPEFRESNPWTVTLKYQNRQMTVPFYTGYGITHDPEAHDVLESLLSDSDVEQYDFEEWASSLGYDPDSRRAERIYNQALQYTKKLHRLLGDDFDLFLYADR